MYIRKVLFISKLVLALVLGYVVITMLLLPEHKEESSTPSSALGGGSVRLNQGTGSIESVSYTHLTLPTTPYV